MKEKITESQIEVKVADLETAPWNPRKEFNEKLVNEIADQLSSGKPLLQRPGVWEYETGKYYIVYGNTRVQACRVAGVNKIGVTLYSCSKEQAMAMTFQENELRDDVHPINQAILIGKIFNSGKSVDEIINSTGLKKSSVYDYLAIAERIHPDILKIAEKRPDCFSKRELMEITSFTKDSQSTMVGYWSEDSEEEDFSPSIWRLRNATRSLKGCKFAGKGSKCAVCQKNTANVGSLPGFEEHKIEGQCEDPKCYEQSINDYLKALVEKNIKKASERFELQYSWQFSEYGADSSKPTAEKPCAYFYVDKYNFKVEVRFGPSIAARKAEEASRKAEEKELRKEERRMLDAKSNIIEALVSAIVGDDERNPKTPASLYEAIVGLGKCSKTVAHFSEDFMRFVKWNASALELKELCGVFLSDFEYSDAEVKYLNSEDNH